MVMIISALLGVALIIYMLIKNLDVKISLLFVGLVLMYIALANGNDIAIKNFSSTGMLLLDPISAVISTFKKIISGVGFVILILGGYTAYMNHIRANDATVSLLLKPIASIKSVYLLIPAVFLIGSLLSLVIPSASNLSIILLATIYPIMRKAGLSALSSAAVIATTATIMPTPLGNDHVAVVGELNKTAEFANISVAEYVFNYHAPISIPTLILMSIVHLFWQRYCDKRAIAAGNVHEHQHEEFKPLEFGTLAKYIYALLPLVPIFLLIIVYFAGASAGIKIEVVVMFSFFIAILCELIRSRSFKSSLESTGAFFKGMGNAINIVALLVAASSFVLGLSSLGVIKALEEIMQNLQSSGAGFVLPLMLILFDALIVIISGSGVALFYAMVPLFVPLADAADLNVLAVSIPMGLSGNLMRAVSPVSAVIMIVSGTINKPPLELVKRTCVPMICGVVFMFILSMMRYL